MTAEAKRERPDVREAAVLVPLFRDDDGDLRIVLIRRVERGVHGGQLAFPGGVVEEGDNSKLATALRETEEEIGLAADAVEILEHLPVVETLSSGYRITPFLARIVRPLSWTRQQDEVAEVLEVRVADLARPEAHGEGVESFPAWPAPRRIGFYRVGARRLWGATYRILHPLLPRLVAEDRSP